MLNLGVTWDDNRHGPEAVRILFDMISRNLPEGTEGTFTCFSDFPDDLGPWIKKQPLSASRDGIRMFPLNCVIVRGLDALLDGKQVKSCFYDGSFPKDAALVLFLDKNPADCDGWVRHVYKIGGGSSAEMSYLPNVAKDRLSANIRHALTLNCRWFAPRPAHDDIAIICGGAPSLRGQLPLLSALAQEGHLFALNGVPAYLAQHGIIADSHVMLDAHPDCLKFVAQQLPVIRYYASQCDPSVLIAAGSSLTCWHGGGEAMTAIKDHTFRHVVGGGSTGASRAMILAYGLGYRRFHLFGLDSSYEDQGHAYPQGDYQKTVDVTCGDQVFKTSPQLLGQAEDLKLILPDLVAAACEITVHGEGLLQALATQMAA